jgi:hypothetical protein
MSWLLIPVIHSFDYFPFPIRVHPSSIRVKKHLAQARLNLPGTTPLNPSPKNDYYFPSHLCLSVSIRG